MKYLYDNRTEVMFPLQHCTPKSLLLPTKISSPTYVSLWPLLPIILPLMHLVFLLAIPPNFIPLRLSFLVSSISRQSLLPVTLPILYFLPLPLTTHIVLFANVSSDGYSYRCYSNHSIHVLLLLCLFCSVYPSLRVIFPTFVTLSMSLLPILLLSKLWCGKLGFNEMKFQ